LRKTRGKNDVVEVSKNLARYRSKNNISLNYQYYYVRHSRMSNAAKNFDILATSFNVLYNNLIIV